jgi:2-polyprenyl-3-methyl-5-hydroxy-6-metoxy-1,4-benzoquinol methylase
MAKALRFDRLVKNREIVGMLIEGSCQHRTRNGYKILPDYKYWKRAREFIASAINKDGKILDIGCANGFLLLCLQSWSGKKLVPYGIDSNPHVVVDAQRLFPKYKQNFTRMRIQELSDLPGKYDVIYWNVWDNWDFKTKEEIRPVRECLRHIKKGGRLILGFYHTDRGINAGKIKRLGKIGFKISGVLQNKHITHLMIAWMDKL